jgi:PEP-CTERM motif
MKKNMMLAILAFAFALFSPQITQAQGTIYVSTLGLPSTGSASVGSDLWLAEGFLTGNNVGGYLLNSVQLALADALGNPSGFRAMVYTVTNDIAGEGPGSSLGTLSGSLDPVAAGTYTYSPGSGLTLLPHTKYYIVLTAGTAVADGAYEWSATSTYAPTLSGGWSGGGIPLYSSAGLNWGPFPPNYPQFAISATDVPEPSTLGLLALGGLFLVRHRRKAKALGTT